MQAVERLAQRASSWLLGSGVEREPSKLEVVGSNPAAAFTFFFFFPLPLCAFACVCCGAVFFMRRGARSKNHRTVTRCWLLGSGVEREPSKLEVVGSNPAAAFILFAFFGREEETEQRLG